jgi:hypothetical protein
MTDLLGFDGLSSLFGVVIGLPSVAMVVVLVCWSFANLYHNNFPFIYYDKIYYNKLGMARRGR